VWYPGNCSQVVIQLTQTCLTDLRRASYQLAHECIHLLSPSEGSHANVFEEGLATHFAHRYIQQEFHFDMPATLASYQVARLLVEQLLALDAESVKTIRARQSTICQTSVEDMRAGCPACPQNIAEHLVRPFVR